MAQSKKVVKAPLVEQTKEQTATADDSVKAPLVEQTANNSVPHHDGVNLIMTAGERQANHNLVVSSVNVQMGYNPAVVHAHLPKVLIKYPSNWTKEKFFKNGDIVPCSKESAETFVEIGIGTIVNE